MATDTNWICFRGFFGTHPGPPLQCHPGRAGHRLRQTHKWVTNWLSWRPS